ncbi:MAG: peptidoglycan DD-metalloendopeptidase family protein [Erysipelotrichaceae bacterium]|nr:peptidoglycan DD-metalloendopeptidase family protein [Erysipelotrichaceae bacterium]
MKIKNALLICLALLLSVYLAYTLSNQNIANGEVTMSDETSLVPQKVLGMYDTPVEITRLFYQGELIGVIHDDSILESTRERTYHDKYEEAFPDTTISYNGDIYFYREKTYVNYEDIDKQIGDYLYDNDLFLVDAYKISLGDKDVIYVKNLDDFKSALRKFVLNFISEETFIKLENREEIISLTTYGEQEVNVSLEDNITAVKSSAPSEEIFTDENEIIIYLCYGRDPQLEYYTVKDFDTIEGVAKKCGMTPQQLVIINDKLNGVNQFIYSGMELNVTYFSPAINVIVEKEKFVSEVVYRPSTKYETDPTMAAGQVIVITKGQDGKKNTLYQEIYVNGVLTSYKQKSTTIVEAPVQEVVRIGAAADSSYIDTGEKNFRLPVDNCYVMCGYGCYYGHRGTDFANQYEPYGKIYACENGVVTHNSYQWDMGWFYCIDHGDGFWFRYLHMSHKGPIPVGATVIRSQYIGDIGMTGTATAPHVHIDIFIGGLNGNRVNPCTVLPC